MEGLRAAWLGTLTDKSGVHGMGFMKTTEFNFLMRILEVMMPSPAKVTFMSYDIFSSVYRVIEGMPLSSECVPNL